MCMLIAIGFVLRVYGGGFLIGVVPTVWIVACTLLLALFLALAKRRDDIVRGMEAGHRPSLAGYNAPFLDTAIAIVLAALLVCYLLYTTQPQNMARLHSDKLFLTVPFVIAGVLRYLQITIVEHRSGSPTRLAVTRPLPAAGHPRLDRRPSPCSSMSEPGWKRSVFRGWGRLAGAEMLAARPERVSELPAILAAAGAEGIIVHAGGRSYGDSALNAGGRAILTRRLDRLLEFDPASGLLAAEAGVSFDDLRRLSCRGDSWPRSPPARPSPRWAGRSPMTCMARTRTRPAISAAMSNGSI